MTPEERAEVDDAVVRVFGGRAGRGWIRGNCPFCFDQLGRPDRRGSLGLNTATGGYNCFRCGTHGRLSEERLDEIPYLPVDASAPPPPPPTVEVADGYLPLYGSLAPADLEPAREYLRGRGLPDVVVADAGVGAALWGRLAGRVIVPIPDYAFGGSPVEQGLARWRGWVSRDYTGRAERPYLYPRGMQREGLLYGAPALVAPAPCPWCVDGCADCGLRGRTPVFVVEGTLDALALWGDAVAVLGKPLVSQVEALARAPRPVVVCLDGDAHEEGLMLALTLRHLGQAAGAIRLPPRVDPDEVPRAALDRAAARSLSLWCAASLD